MAAAPAQIVKRLEALKGLRSLHEQHWRDCFDYTFPLRGSGIQQTSLTAQTAQDKKADLLDDTGTDAARILGSGLMSGLTPANAQWAKTTIEGASPDEERWLDESSTKLWKLIHASNFDAAAYEGMLDLVCAGWFGLYVEEGENGFEFELWPIAQLYATSSKPGQRIDTVDREYELTAEVAVAQYGDACSDQTRKLAQSNPDAKVTFVRAIYPRPEGSTGALRASNLPIASCTIERDTKTLVAESGYHEMPVIVPRWMLLPNSPYAIGPAFDALPSMRRLNHIAFNEMAAGDIAIGGMWIAEDDGVLNPRTVKIGPRKIIVANSVDSMKELRSGADFSVTFTMEERLQAQIRKIFMADQLQPQDGPAMTATEVHVRVALIRQLLGPVYGRLQAEYLQPLVERCWGLAYRAGAFGMAPESLRGRKWSIKYTSPLALAQSLEEVTAMDRYETTLMAEAQVQQDVIDNYDWDAAAQERAKKLGVPAAVMRTPEKVEARRAQRAEAEAKAQNTAQVQDALQDGTPEQRLAGLMATEEAA